MTKTQDKKPPKANKPATNPHFNDPVDFHNIFEMIDSVIALNGRENRIIAVGCSGGVDSMALTHMLNAWAKKNNAHIHALIVDHNLRAASAAEAEVTRTALSSYEHVTPFILKWDDGAGVKTAIQERARDARYTLMTYHCAAHNIKHLCIAHHMDDQFETVLFRLAGGSGLDGLCGMQRVYKFNDAITIARPLLAVTKNDIQTYCLQNNLTYINDPSNQNDRFSRVRLRNAHDALATEGLTPARLVKTANRLSRARDALDFYTTQAFDDFVEIIDKKTITMSISIAHDAPTEIFIRVLLRCITILLSPASTKPLRLSRIESIAADLLNMNTPMKGRTLAGIKFKRDDTRKIIVLTKLSMF